jgi:hypothetical protein
MAQPVSQGWLCYTFKQNLWRRPMDYDDTVVDRLFSHLVILGGLLLLLGVGYLLAWLLRAWDESRRREKERVARMERFRRTQSKRRLLPH